jgi:glycosyl transferase/beta-hydroxylase protein BlmF
MLCPTRNRTVKVQRFVASVHRTCADPGHVELLFYVDDDDPALDAYRRTIEQLQQRYPDFRAIELVVGPPISVSRSWNTLAQASAGDLLMMANDDQLYVDYGWDRRLDEYVRAAPDPVFAMFFEDGQYPPDGGDFPIVSRTWYETLGYFTPGIFEFWYNEAWIFDIANRLQRITRIPKVLVEHLHYSDYKSVLDDTYKRHRLNFEKADRDRKLFERTADDRQAAADKLRPLMAS